MLKVEPDGDVWRVTDESGAVLHRGPEWECWLAAADGEARARRTAWKT